MEARVEHERCLSNNKEKDSLLELFLNYCKNGIIINYKDRGDKLYNIEILNNFEYELNESLILYDSIGDSTFIIDNVHKCAILEFDSYIMIENEDKIIMIDELL